MFLGLGNGCSSLLLLKLQLLLALLFLNVLANKRLEDSLLTTFLFLNGSTLFLFVLADGFLFSLVLGLGNGNTTLVLQVSLLLLLLEAILLASSLLLLLAFECSTDELLLFVTRVRVVKQVVGERVSTVGVLWLLLVLRIVLLARGGCRVVRWVREE
ncbi:MAG: hypothetical protein BYD32DRAFT_418320 [Podila humilis]|nr:MAG: hypothetical protein BYD32DRAFT_418320 [Podila humilis]